MNRYLLHKYMSGTCSREEKVCVEEWLNESSRNKEILDEMKQIWDVPIGNRINVDSRKAWDIFSESNFNKQYAHEKNRDVNQKIKHILYSQKSNNGLYSRAILFSAAVVALIAFILFKINSFPTGQSITERMWQEISTQRGQKTTIRLSDGTQIKINAESKISIPDDYMEQERFVLLEGEAYFEVTPDKDKPFIVRTDKSVTRVLGTKFNIRTYPNEDKVQVVVAEGKVVLSSDDKLNATEIQLTKNQKGVINEEGEFSTFKVSELNMYLDWTDNRLTFRDATLEEVKRTLERWYDIEIKFEKSVSKYDRLMTGTFKDVSLNSILKSVSLSLDLQYQRVDNDNKVIFKSKNR